MAEITMTVRQIMNLGLWDKVCEYKGWNPWILNEGRIGENESVTFNDTFEKPEEKKDRAVIDALIESLHEASKKLDDYIVNSGDRRLTEDALQNIREAITGLTLATRDES